MAAAMKLFIWFCIIFVTAPSVKSVPSPPPACYLQPNPILHRIQLQCPLSIWPSLSIEMDGESLVRALGTNPPNAYTAVLFYASWCPFSRGIRSKFDVLSSMFPHITHLAIDQSSAMPSIFSRYGIHSVPSILLVHHGVERYSGPKNLQHLVGFYKRTTGLAPVDYLNEDQFNLSNRVEEVSRPWHASSLKEFLLKEPYLMLAFLFLGFRAVLHFFPRILSCLVTLWVLHFPHLNLGIFGEASQHLGRMFHLIDVKGMWSKLKVCKTRNFHEHARNARVWASSLASVSLGKSSSTRASSLRIS